MTAEANGGAISNAWCKLFYISVFVVSDVPCKVILTVASDLTLKRAAFLVYLRFGAASGARLAVLTIFLVFIGARTVLALGVSSAQAHSSLQSSVFCFIHGGKQPGPSAHSVVTVESLSVSSMKSSTVYAMDFALARAMLLSSIMGMTHGLVGPLSAPVSFMLLSGRVSIYIVVKDLSVGIFEFFLIELFFSICAEKSCSANLLEALFCLS